MKQTLTLLILFILFQSLSAQQHISVESFKMLETDLDARVHHPKRDQNGEVAALIKVVTTETGFAWDGGSLGIVAAERKTGEYWVYIPRGAQRLTISHDRLGVLRNYAFPIPIEAATVYEMRLVTGRVETTVIPPQIESQWLVITSEPEGADVYINDEPVGKTPYYNELPVGRLTWRINANLYQPAAGVIELKAGQENRAEIHEVLNPDYGTLIIRSTPESGAEISVNGFETGQKTPATIQRIKSGEVLISIRLNDYETTSRQIELEAGAELTVDIPMRPTFAMVTIETEPTSDIFINEQRRGNGRWEGRLGTGIYNFEARLDKHRPAIERRQVNALENFALKLNPQPITGNLRVISSPHGAGIRIAGADYGTTPTTIRNLLIGNYDVELNLSGHASVAEKITIKENETAEMNATLPAGMEVTITSEPTGAELFINHQKVGTTPYTGQLGFGSHNLKLVNRSRTVEETITITQGGRREFTFNVSETKDYTETAAGLNLEMVFVKGGTFNMGCTGEQGSDCFDSEKPTRRVTVGDFYMGKFEVTQKQWRDVMGNNPSRFKNCDNCPVESVSWNDVQEFIKKLNQLTGKKYRLPTEAEWEYAARGGNQSRGYKYAGSNTIDEVAWFSSNSSSKTRPVGGKDPNGLGLYDMSGNVWEWCEDDWHGHYEGAPTDGRTWIDSPRGSRRVMRGGSRYSGPQRCRVSHRGYSTPGYRYGSIGFRLSRMD